MSPEEQADRNLLTAVAAGSEPSLRELYHRYESRIYRFALTRLSEAADAADVVNDVMLQVWRSADRYQGRSRVSTWILGIAHHKVADRLRQRGRHEGDELDERLVDDNSPDGLREATAEQEIRQLQFCMKRLSAIQRQVLELTFLEHCSYHEISEILSCPQGTVKTRVFHARKLLRKCIDQFFGEATAAPR